MFPPSSANPDLGSWENGASGSSRGARLASPGSFSRGSIAVWSWFDRSVCTVKLSWLGQPDFEKHPSVSNTGTVQNVLARWYLLARNISWPWAPWGLNLVASGAKWVGCRLYILSSNRITSGDQPHQELAVASNHPIHITSSHRMGHPI